VFFGLNTYLDLCLPVERCSKANPAQWLIDVSSGLRFGRGVYRLVPICRLMQVLAVDINSPGHCAMPG